MIIELGYTVLPFYPPKPAKTLPHVQIACVLEQKITPLPSFFNGWNLKIHELCFPKMEVLEGGRPFSG